MNNKIILLANSRKLGGRCLAGIVVEERVAGNFTIHLDNGSPKWVRPVSDGHKGEISLETAEKFQNLEIVELMGMRPSSIDFQTENVHVDDMRSIQRTQLTENDLDLLCDCRHDVIFGNKGKSVIAELINELDYSLMMIKPIKFKSYETLSIRGNKQIRGKFHFKGMEYDLPITDSSYKVGAENSKNVYLSMSLGLEFEGWHSKLIAGVHYL